MMVHIGKLDRALSHKRFRCAKFEIFIIMGEREMEFIYDKRTLFIAILLLFLSASSAFAEEGTSRWVYLGHEEDFDIYYDRQTVTYNPDTHTIMMWERQVSNKDIIYLNQYYIFLDTHKYQFVKRAIYNSRTGSKDVRKYPQAQLQWIFPESDIEKIADYICDQYGASHMFPNRTNRWMWLFSSDRQTYMYATDYIIIDKDNNTVGLWIRYSTPQGFISSPSLYTCHIDTQTIDYLGGRGISKGMDIFPDTFEESVWNKAKEIYDKSKLC